MLLTLSIRELIAVQVQEEAQPGQRELVFGFVVRKGHLQRVLGERDGVPGQQQELRVRGAGSVDDAGILGDVVQHVDRLVGVVQVGDVELQRHLGQHAGLVGGGVRVRPAAYVRFRHRSSRRGHSSASCCRCCSSRWCRRWSSCVWRLCCSASSCSASSRRCCWRSCCCCWRFLGSWYDDGTILLSCNREREREERSLSQQFEAMFGFETRARESYRLSSKIYFCFARVDIPSQYKAQSKQIETV
uniref:(northern house mosquito) hypothetical protein n=1 Tax=Culex pipiens TaxID=7175 RepID=A0A8D8FAH5_CULPI